MVSPRLKVEEEPEDAVPLTGVEKVTSFVDGKQVPFVLRSNPRVSAAPRAMGRGPLRMKPIRVTLASPQTAVSSAAGAALSNTIGMSPATFTDWSSFAAVYDECKVLGGSVYQKLILPYTAAVAVQASVWTTVYDPIDGVALANIGNALTYAQTMGPQICVRDINTAVIPCGESPASATRNGFHTLRFKVPRGAARNTANPTWVQGEWSATGDAGDIYGFVKSFAVGHTGLQYATLISVITLDVEFRSRQ